jgi:hypothetical protein
MAATTRKLILGALTLVCVKCTRQNVFRGTDATTAIAQAEARGWRRVRGKLVCGKCPK